MTAFIDIVKRFDCYAVDGPGAADPEIVSLKPLHAIHDAFDSPREAVDPSKKLVVVVVEARLLDQLPASHLTRDDLLARLLQYRWDLAREGRQARFVLMRPYSGPVRKDGKTVIAIREFFKAVRAAFMNFEGALLVGSFPEASITRTYPQGPNEQKEYRVGGPVGNFAGRRFDIVLADLTGNWHLLYHQNVTVQTYVFTAKESTSFVNHGTKVTITNPEVTPEKHMMQDVFWIQDEACTLAGSQVILDTVCRNPEVASADLGQTNPVARPDISVSRVNARMVAVAPPHPRLLAVDGKPASVPNRPEISFSYDAWPHDLALERRLLVDYFDRNHAFRTTTTAPHRLTLIESAGLGTAAIAEGLCNLGPVAEKVRDATLLDFVRWLKGPATLRGISSHADCISTFMVPVPDMVTHSTQVEAEIGGRPWRWVDEGGRYVPSLRGHSTADFFVLRTGWENGVWANTPSSLLMHSGCDVNGITNPEVGYDHPRYGTMQNADSLLFYGNQLAVLSHTTQWNEGPAGFGEAFGASNGSVVGEGWKGISEATARDAALAPKTTERKENYIWGLVGDWTLRKRYSAPVTSARQLVAACNANGCMELFSTGLDNQLYRHTRLPMNFAWATGLSMAGGCRRLAVGTNLDGRLELFTTGTDDRLQHRWQIESGGPWTDANTLPGKARQIAVARNRDGRLELFYVGMDDRLYHNWQTEPNGSWTLQNALPGKAKQIAVGANADGRLELLYIGHDDRLYHNWQTEPNGSWTLQNALSGKAKQITVGANADGRLELFYIGTDDRLYHNWQIEPNGSWTLEECL